MAPPKYGYLRLSPPFRFLAGWAVTWLMAFSTPLTAQHIFVQAIGDAGHGTGLLWRIDGKCYVATANHIVNRSSDHAILRDRLGQSLTGRILSQDTITDLALIRFDTPTRNCREWPRTERVRYVLAQEQHGHVRYADEDGMVQVIDVLIYANQKDIFVRPLRPESALREGMSGGGIYVGELLVGMLISGSVDSSQGRGYVLDHVWSVLRPAADDIPRWRFLVKADGGLLSSQWLGPEDLGSEDRLYPQRKGVALEIELPTRFGQPMHPRAYAGVGLLEIAAAETGTNPGGSLGTAIYLRSGADLLYRPFASVPMFVTGGASISWFPTRTDFSLESAGTEPVPVSIPAQVTPEISAGAGGTINVATLALETAAIFHWLPTATLERRGLKRNHGFWEAGLQVGLRIGKNPR